VKYNGLDKNNLLIDLTIEFVRFQEHRRVRNDMCSTSCATNCAWL